MNRSQLLMLKNVELGTLDEGLQKTKQLQNAIDKKTICRLSKHMTQFLTFFGRTAFRN
jgi:hypothetical protein